MGRGTPGTRTLIRAADTNPRADVIHARPAKSSARSIADISELERGIARTMVRKRWQIENRLRNRQHRKNSRERERASTARACRGHNSRNTRRISFGLVSDPSVMEDRPYNNW